MNVSDIQDLVERCKQRGMNPVERLDHLGLLLTDDRRNKLLRETCQLLADRIEQESIRNLVGKSSNAYPITELKQGIVRYIRENFKE